MEKLTYRINKSLDGLEDYLRSPENRVDSFIDSFGQYLGQPLVSLSEQVGNYLMGYGIVRNLSEKLNRGLDNLEVYFKNPENWFDRNIDSLGEEINNFLIKR